MKGLVALALVACARLPSTSPADAGVRALVLDAGPQPEEGDCIPAAGGCDASLACVPVDAARSLGFCTPICTTGTDARCTNGKRCAIEPGETRGVCLDVVANGGECASDQRLFCDPATHSACLYLQQGDATGTCFSICHLKAVGSECPTPQQCMNVLGDATLGVCLAVASAGKPCGIALQTICDRTSICVGEQNLDGTMNDVCAAVCTNGETCPSGTNCTLLSDGATKACI